VIPCANPHAQYAAYRTEIDLAIKNAVESGRYILGPQVEAFESEFARYIGVKDAVGVSSGTDALHLALAACHVGQGDEVITVAHTAVATVSAIEMAGAVPVFVDIDPTYFTIDPALIEPAITSRTRAIVAVHLYGQPADMHSVLEIARRHRLRVIEDCAQAHGAEWHGRRVGSWGDIGCFSFYPTKNLGALGDGGIVVTGDAELAARVRLLREYGWSSRYVSEIPGWNSRLDEIQAALLRVKLTHLDADNERRRLIAEYYTARLGGAGVTLPMGRPESRHAWHLYVVRAARRDALRDELAANGVGTLVHYPVPIHLQPAYSKRSVRGPALPATEQAAREVLSLPMYPQLLPGEIEFVANAAISALAVRER
jgi:dTDP-4-amino-4,6-dideoxygalactose transaminase